MYDDQDEKCCINVTPIQLMFNELTSYGRQVVGL